MKNYQSLYYKNYFAQNADGDYIPVNRKDCFSPGETPTPDTPFRQRWFYDPEAGYAVRLERNQRGEDTYLVNSASLKKEEKDIENGKYAFRCFLLRLGFIGNKFKDERKILLRHFTGSSAFKKSKEVTDND